MVFLRSKSLVKLIGSTQFIKDQSCLTYSFMTFGAKSGNILLEFAIYHQSCRKGTIHTVVFLRVPKKKKVWNWALQSEKCSPREIKAITSQPAENLPIGSLPICVFAAWMASSTLGCINRVVAARRQSGVFPSALPSWGPICSRASRTGAPSKRKVELLEQAQKRQQRWSQG